MSDSKNPVADVMSAARIAATDNLIADLGPELRSGARALAQARHIYFEEGVAAGFSDEQAFQFCMSVRFHD